MLLLIDTPQETATVALSRDGKVLFSEENKISKEHASWLHSAIGRLLAEADMTLEELKAVAVIAGPGSYTGLRVGMAAAKGFCYALNIPLITRNTLEVMAESMRFVAGKKKALICPMIDARRDEVFTALYSISLKPKAESLKPIQSLKPKAESLKPIQNLKLKAGSLKPIQSLKPKAESLKPIQSLKPKAESLKPEPVNGQLPTANVLTELLPPQALILDKNAFETQLAENAIIFFGSGAEKWEKITESPSAIFEPQPGIIQAFATLAHYDFISGNWADTVYSEPIYLKEFFTY